MIKNAYTGKERMEVCEKTLEMFSDYHLETLIGGPWSFAMELRGVEETMEDLVSLGIDGISIDSPASLEKMFAVGQGKTTIIGNIDPILFLKGSFDQLEEKVKECFEISKGEPKYAIAPGCQIPLASPLENIEHFTACCHKYGAH